jgi:MFS family permease
LQLKEVERFSHTEKFDWTGTILFTTSLLCLLIVLSFGGFFGWTSVTIISLLPVGVICFLFFIWVETRAKYPMLDLRLFKSSQLAYGFWTALLNSIARGAVTFILTFFLQIILSLDPIMAAIYLTPFAIGLALGSPISGKLTDKYGARGVSTIGLAVSAFGLLGMIFISTSMPFAELALWMSLMGFGSGLFFSPNGKLIMGVVPPHKRGIANGVRSMFFNAGSLISMGLALAILSSAVSLNTLTNLFLGLQVGSAGVAVDGFIRGIQLVFAISFVASLGAVIMSSRKGVPPQWDPEEEEEASEGTLESIPMEVSF